MSDRINAAVIGAGGRETRLVKALAESDIIDTVHATPGNGGTRLFGVNTVRDPMEGYGTFLSYVREHDIRLVVIGPEAPLVSGVADRLREDGLSVVGVDQAAARFEGSKIFARRFMAEYGIPHPEFHLFENPEKLTTIVGAKAMARSYLDDFGGAVVKADGLCGGKGAFVTRTPEEVADGLHAMHELKGVGRRFLVEEMLKGPELSVTVLVGHDDHAILSYSQDHKQARDGDQGPMTGGMGAITVDLPEGLEARIEDEIIIPTLEGSRDAGLPIRNGVLYVGLMLTPQGPKVLEYNMRFGDPECQVVLPRYDGDAGELLWKAARGESFGEVELRDEHFANVVLAAKGYPEPGYGTHTKGEPIYGVMTGAARTPGVEVLLGNAEYVKGRPVKIAGSRVVNVIGGGESPEAASNVAYKAVGQVWGEHHRNRWDIGRNLPALKDACRAYR